MIIMQRDKPEPLVTPVIRCETCRKPITNGALAAVVFSRGAESVPVFVHKGECHTEVDNGAMSPLPWQELNHWLVWLCESVGMTSGAKLDESREIAGSLV